MKNLIMFLALLFVVSCSPQIPQVTAPPVNVPKANFNKPKTDTLVIDFRNNDSLKDMIKRQGAIVPIDFRVRDRLIEIQAYANCQRKQDKARKSRIFPNVEYRVLGRHPTKNVWLCVPNQLTKHQMKQNCEKMKMKLVGFDDKNWHTFSCARREK